MSIANAHLPGTRRNCKTPLLIHTKTIDEDVNVLEVEHLIAALKAAGKQFEYKVYQNAPGGHAFQSAGHKACEGVARGGLSFPGEASEPCERGEVG